MALSDYYKKKSAELTATREQLAVERARNSVQELMNSEQFKLSALALPESKMAVDAIVENTVKTVLSPVSQFTDTLRAKGFRPADIRSAVHRLYDLYNLGPTGQDVRHEDMLDAVASYVMQHQELYNTLDPSTVRGDS